MIRLTRVLPAGSGDVAAQLLLPYELRTRSRLRTHLSTGEEAALLMERGRVLRGGDRLLAEDGRVIEVVAQEEVVSTVRAGGPLVLARACYHLGNRHVALQIGDGWLRYLEDYVLDELVRGLGLQVFTETAPFEPEAGAYGHGH